MIAVLAALAFATDPECGCDKRRVYVARGDLYPGITITEEDVQPQDLFTDEIPPEAFSDADLLVGRIPKDRILAGEVVRADRLADGAPDGGLTALIAPGMRAMAVRVDVPANLQAGAHVDVILGGGDGPPCLVAELVPVLSVVRAGPVVLMLTPTQVGRVGMIDAEHVKVGVRADDDLSRSTIPECP